MGRIYLIPKFMTDEEKKNIYIAINVKIYIKKKSLFPRERLYRYINILHRNNIRIGMGVFSKNAKR